MVIPSRASSDDGEHVVHLSRLRAPPRFRRAGEAAAPGKGPGELHQPELLGRQLAAEAVRDVDSPTISMASVGAAARLLVGAACT